VFCIPWSHETSLSAKIVCCYVFTVFHCSDKFHSILLVEAETENSFVSAMSYSPGQDMQSVVMVKLSLCTHEDKTGA
jgi:hypothetical protein